MSTTKTESRNFEMYSKAGNRACENLVKKIEKKIQGEKRVTKEEIIAMIGEGIEKISEKHGEVYDSEPPYNICHYVSKTLAETGYGFEISHWDV